MTSPVDDGELWRVGTRESKGYREKKKKNGCALVVHGFRINNQYSVITN